MISFLMDFIVACLMTAFLKFHIMLASENKTTIENLYNDTKIVLFSKIKRLTYAIFC